MAATTDKPWLKLYSPGDPSEITAEYETALEMFDAAVAADPDAPMLKYFDTTLSAHGGRGHQFSRGGARRRRVAAW